MARSHSNSRRRRENTYFTNRRLPSPTRPRSHLRLAPSPSSYSNNFLRQIEDRRTFHPLGPYRPARSFTTSRHLLTVPRFTNRNLGPPRPYVNVNQPIRDIQRRSRSTALPHQIGFERPDSVLVCVRRRQRREVLHALKKTGRAGQKRPRFTEYSTITCRR